MGNMLDEYPNIRRQWATDVSFDGIRLEVFTETRDIEFDVSITAHGKMTVNTFSKEAPADLIVAAIEIAKSKLDGEAV